MKATGLVRRIDESGDIIIPVELRRKYKIREGDLVEIYVENDGVIVFKKYSPIEKDADIAALYVMKANKNIKSKMIVIDTEKVIAGVVKYIDKYILEEFDEIFAKKSFYCYNGDKMIVCDSASEYVKYAMPIIVDGYAIGAVVCVADEENVTTDENSDEAMLTKLTASMLSKYYGN